MCRRQPNASHVACASLLNSNAASLIITQNIDGLHQDAVRAARNVDPKCRSTPEKGIGELHGNIHRVKCLSCGAKTSRADLQRRLADANRQLLEEHPDLAAASVLPQLRGHGDVQEGDQESDSVLEMASEKSVKRSRTPAVESTERFRPTGMPAPAPPSPSDRPDGDFEASQKWIDNFTIVPCEQCGRTALKPDMVFFGENTDAELVQECFRQVEGASCVICIGTSMEVFSAYRFVIRAADKGVPVAILNTGPTRADKNAALKVDASVERVLPYVALRHIPLANC